jgi:hypothetical protein
MDLLDKLEILDEEFYKILKEVINDIRSYYNCAVKNRERVFNNKGTPYMPGTGPKLTGYIINSYNPNTKGGTHKRRKNKRNTKKRSRTVRSKRA